MAVLQPYRGSASAWAQRENSCCAQAYDGDHGVLRAASADRVAMPGDAVVAVAVEAQPRGHERFSQLAGICVVEPSPKLREAGARRCRDLIRQIVEADQARNIKDPVVHLATFSPPRD